MKYKRSFISALLVLAFSPVYPSFGEMRPVVQDTHVNGKSGREDDNYGTSDTIKVAPNNPFQGLIKFDLSGISGTVSTALLTFDVADVRFPGWVDLYAAGSDWNESTVTFNTKPDFFGPPIASVLINPSDEGGLITVDIASAAQSWVSSPSENYGLFLVSAGANVRFTSKEGGSGAILTFEANGGTGDPRPSSVTVAPVGGDYTNPADAADNALSGDQWCDLDRSTGRGCVINVLPGTYTIDRTIQLYDPISEISRISLVGSGSESTRIVAGPGVDETIVGARVNSLSITNTEPSGNDKFGIVTGRDEGAFGHDLAIRVAGGNNGYGIKAGEDTTFLDDSVIDVSGATGATGLRVWQGFFSDIEVSVRSSSGRAVGVDDFTDDAGLEIERSVIEARGENSAAVSPRGGSTIRTSKLISIGNNSSALSVNVRDGSLYVYNTEIRGFGQGSRGVSIFTLTPERHIFDEVTVFGDIAFQITSGDDRTHTEISDSSLIGDSIALFLDQMIRPLVYSVNIDRSTLQAPIAVEAKDAADARIGASKVDGIRNLGTSSFTCVFAYDGNYQPLNATCQ